jgi:endonuclease YncB( thermonuclease family)
MKKIATALLALATVASAPAQVVVGSGSTGTTLRDTPARNSEYTVGYRGRDRRPANYDYWYYRNSSPYALSPFVYIPAVQVKQPVPAMPRYSDVQYGNYVEQVVSASPVQAASARANTESVVDKAGSQSTDKAVNATQAHVVDVLDRGILVLDTYDEVKLRGVDMESENEIDEVTRYYARLGIDTLRRLTMNGAIQIQLGTPERNSDGYILADIILADGSLLNRQILELGYGHFDGKDFAPDQVSVTLQAAEQRARTSKVGLFSKQQQ